MENEVCKSFGLIKLKTHNLDALPIIIFYTLCSIWEPYFSRASIISRNLRNSQESRQSENDDANKYKNRNLGHNSFVTNVLIDRHFRLPFAIIIHRHGSSSSVCKPSHSCARIISCPLMMTLGTQTRCGLLLADIATPPPPVDREDVWIYNATTLIRHSSFFSRDSGYAILQWIAAAAKRHEEGWPGCELFLNPIGSVISKSHKVF